MIFVINAEIRSKYINLESLKISKKNLLSSMQIEIKTVTQLNMYFALNQCEEEYIQCKVAFWAILQYYWADQCITKQIVCNTVSTGNP